MRIGILEVPTVEVRSVARAAAKADGPEVIGRQRQQCAAVAPFDGDGGHAVHIQVPEAHGPPEIQRGAVGKPDPAGVHELLPAHHGRVHRAVLVEVHVVVVLVHVCPEVEVPKDDAQDPGHEHCQEEEDEPLGLVDLEVWPELHPDCSQGQRARHDHRQQAKGAQQVADVWPQMMQLEGHHRVDEAEEGPGQHEALDHGDQVHPLPLAAHEEVPPIAGEATKAAVELGLGEEGLLIRWRRLHGAGLFSLQVVKLKQARWTWRSSRR
mmetsp:Transcript_86815/g.202037  ORF Transcript_86815/g.202037 Transcript_86815/m.202037 type:complete len:266 (+) Transcript_86815:397-1194(+)